MQEEGEVAGLYPAPGNLRSDGGGGALCDDYRFQGNTLEFLHCPVKGKAPAQQGSDEPGTAPEDRNLEIPGAEHDVFLITAVKRKDLSHLFDALAE